MKRFLLSAVLLMTVLSLKAIDGDTITYKSKNRLEWSDFKKSPNSNDSLKVYLDLTIATFTKKVNVWWGTITVESYAGIRRDLSWVKPQYKSQQLLDYVQLKYDIANYYAKKSETEVNSKKINAGFTTKIGKIIESNIDSMNNVFIKLDVETNFGNNTENLDKWKSKLYNKEL